ncbi:MAG: cell division protein FtsQ/DivIB [Minisyncoccota bacterium]
MLFGTVIYGLWQRPFRISRVVIYGADQSLADTATAAMQGSYLGIAPRDSTFLVPEARIRTLIASAHPDIAAVSIFRSGFTDLSIKVDYRVPIARWCGSSPASTTGSGQAGVASSTPMAGCYFFDASGFVYSPANETASVNSFAVYESVATTSNPIGTSLPHADTFPAAFDFARQLSTFGSPVASVVFRDDEVDVYLASGTRITYVVGSEEGALNALASARADLNLADGSLDYVDLRFPGKVYVKKKV